MNAKVEKPKSILKKTEGQTAGKKLRLGGAETIEFQTDDPPGDLDLEEVVHTRASSDRSEISKEMKERVQEKLQAWIDYFTGAIEPEKEKSSYSLQDDEKFGGFFESLGRLLKNNSEKLKPLRKRLESQDTTSETALEPVNREEYVDFFRLLGEKGIGFSNLANNDLTQRGAGIRLHLPMKLDVESMAKIAQAAENLGLTVTKRVRGGKPDGIEFSMDPQSALRAYEILKDQSRSTEEAETYEREIGIIEKHLEFHNKTSRPTPQRNRLGLTEAKLLEPIKKGVSKEHQPNDPAGQEVPPGDLHALRDCEVKEDTLPKKSAPSTPSVKEPGKVLGG